jgi:hypothetical protein
VILVGVEIKKCPVKVFCLFSPSFYVSFLKEPTQQPRLHSLDPYLTSQYIVAFTRGLQEGEDPRYVKVNLQPYVKQLTSI